MKKASLRVVCSFCAGIFWVAGCGQTGPLYMPTQTESAAELVEQGVKKQNTVLKKQSTLSASSFSASRSATAEVLTPQSAATSSIQSAH